MKKNKEREKARMPRLNRLARLFSSVALVTSSSCCLFLVHSSMRKRSRRGGTKKNRLAKRCATFFALGRFLTFLVFVVQVQLFRIITTLVDTKHGRGIDEDGEYDNGGVVKL